MKLCHDGQEFVRLQNMKYIEIILTSWAIQNKVTLRHVSLTIVAMETQQCVPFVLLTYMWSLTVQMR